MFFDILLMFRSFSKDHRVKAEEIQKTHFRTGHRFVLNSNIIALYILKKKRTLAHRSNVFGESDKAYASQLNYLYRVFLK